MLGIPQPQNGLSVNEWCTKHGLGEEECRGLIKLGFQVGNDLDVVDIEMWQWAGLGPFHRHRIMSACKIMQSAPSA